MLAVGTPPMVDFCNTFEDPVPASRAEHEEEPSSASISTVTWLWTTLEASPMASPCWTRRRVSTAEAAAPGVAARLAVAVGDGEPALVVPQATITSAQRSDVAA